jgi:hypothetical protein
LFGSLEWGEVGLFVVVSCILTKINYIYKMDKDLKEKVEKRIVQLGLKKEHVAKQIGLDKVRFSQTLSGKRNITPSEYSALVNYLSL